jgi:hypothetical protein
MTIEKARELIGNLVQCGLYANGVLDEKPANIEVSLAELMEANEIVKKANDEAREKQRAEGGSCSIQMTVAERGIAAMFTAANFKGGSLSEPNIIGYGNGNYLLVVHERHFKREETEEEK